MLASNGMTAQKLLTSVDMLARKLLTCVQNDLANDLRPTKTRWNADLHIILSKKICVHNILSDPSMIFIRYATRQVMKFQSFQIAKESSTEIDL